MVEQVGTFRNTDPQIVNPILDSIDAISTKALHCLGNPKKLGNYMNVNHALLEALGVGHPMLTKLVVAARAAGAYGAKITGAGGGGCMIALCPKKSKSKIAGAIEACEGRAIITTIDTEGVRKENDKKSSRKAGR